MLTISLIYNSFFVIGEKMLELCQFSVQEVSSHFILKPEILLSPCFDVELEGGNPGPQKLDEIVLKTTQSLLLILSFFKIIHRVYCMCIFLFTEYPCVEIRINLSKTSEKWSYYFCSQVWQA